MPSELVSCPECQRKLRVPEDLLHKLVKCPTCGQTFTADPAALPPPPPPPEDRPARPSKVSRDDDEDEEDDEDRSRRRRRSSRRDRDDEDDDDRPRRRRSRFSRDDDDVDDDDDDRPRRRRRHYAPHRGGAVLTLGVLSLVLPFFFPLAGLICGIIAWSMGNTDLAEIRSGHMDPEGEGQTNGGRVCGMISVILHVLGIVVFFCLCLGIMASNH
jgi:predicted Zn finger-like uncharacterized protein